MQCLLYVLALFVEFIWFGKKVPGQTRESIQTIDVSVRVGAFLHQNVEQHSETFYFRIVLAGINGYRF